MTSTPVPPVAPVSPPNFTRYVKQRSPEKSELPLQAVVSVCTPIELFYVRNHFPEVPVVDPAAYRLTIHGLVEHPVSLALAELRSLPRRELIATMECAGNGGPTGALERGGVSTARWAGASLADVLARVGVTSSAREIAVRGLDTGVDPDLPDTRVYERSLPLAKALHPDTLLCYEMNGEPLPPLHGGPLRLVVPAWFGSDWIKWIGELEAIPAASEHPYMTRRYREYLDETGDSYGPMVRDLAVKSLICRPAPRSRLSLAPVAIEGVAWAGERAVAGVDVSVDGGATWTDATLLTDRDRYYWTLWRLDWQPAGPGRYTLLARATDSAGEAQPLEWSGRKYRANFVERIEVEVA